MRSVAEFNLASLLKDVREIDGRETIEYLPFDRIDPDPDNFYSLVGLENLADNIATVGLLDPLRVRPNGDRYTVTSGHRRLAAIRLLIDSGEERWREAVPCIVDRGEATAEFNELRLIYANSSTRQLSAAEESRQAERVEALLLALRDQGYPFPGRIRDHVAEVVGKSKTKLARLHAIRANLRPGLLELFDAGTLNESAAYELQKLPAEAQDYLAQRKSVQRDGVSVYDAEQLAKRAESYLKPDCHCPDGSACGHTLPRFAQAINGYHDCRGGCCLSCHYESDSDCPYRCLQSKKQIEAGRAEKRAEKDRAEARERDRLDQNRRKIAQDCAAWYALARNAGMSDDEVIGLPIADTVGGLKECANDPARISDYRAREPKMIFRYDDLSDVVNFADRAGVSVDYLLGRTAPAPATAPEAAGFDPGRDAPRWRHSRTMPERLGRYLCLASISQTTPTEYRLELTEDGWCFYGQALHDDVEVLAWWPLPDAVSAESFLDEDEDDGEEGDE